MLPHANRMRRSSHFSSVVSGGRRAGRGALVVHHLTALRAQPAPIVGLVVGKQVGSSVMRHRVSRRLRAQLRERLDLLPAGSGTVVRALPAAADATSTALGRDLDTALGRVL